MTKSDRGGRMYSEREREKCVWCLLCADGSRVSHMYIAVCSVCMVWMVWLTFTPWRKYISCWLWCVRASRLIGPVPNWCFGVIKRVICGRSFPRCWWLVFFLFWLKIHVPSSHHTLNSIVCVCVFFCLVCGHVSCAVRWWSGHAKFWELSPGDYAMSLGDWKPYTIYVYIIEVL